MLSTLFLITLTIWLGLTLLSLITFRIKHEKTLSLLRIVSIPLALLTISLGLTGLITHQIISITIPWLNFGFHPHLRLDALASFFILLLGLSYLGISFFSLNYFKHFSLSQQKKIQSLELLFVFAILLVFIANDPFMFLFSWEVMALSSYFLVVGIEPNKNNRKAGLLYLGIAHLGFFALAVSFFLLYSSTDFSMWQLDLIPTFKQTHTLANVIFILAFFGFGAKAGLFPLHVWLPEAHPAAPSPISALMSGVMLKTAIYGLIRFIFVFLLPYQQSWWGYSLVVLGLVTMFIGVVHAALQTDMKRLLAYSSMENMGFIITALGLAIVFYNYHQFILAGLALLVVLLHALNHSIFKSLLFLGTGSILHATGERNLGKLGGLIHKMPWVSVCTLIGVLAMAGLPLFNGFISEWLYLSIFFHQPATSHFLLAILSPLIIAISVLVFGLAGFVTIKFYGIAFLGQPREFQLAHVHPSSLMERVGLIWLASLCIFLGLWPNGIITLLQTLMTNLSPRLLEAIQSSGSSIRFISTAASGFNPLCLEISLGLLLLLTFLLLKYLSSFKIRRAPCWDCGFPDLTPHMQDTAEGFGQPFKQIFLSLMNIKLQLPKAEDKNPRYRSQITEKIWQILYFPLLKLITQLASLTKWIQQGHISTYLLFIGITLLILLTWVVWA